MTAIRSNFRNQISTTIPQPYDPLNLGLPGTGQLSPLARERYLMQDGRYLSGFGQDPECGEYEVQRPPPIMAPQADPRLAEPEAHYALDDEPDWSDHLVPELAEDDDSMGTGIFNADGMQTTNADMGVFADDYAIPGYIARNPPFYVNPEVQDVTADAIVLEVPAGGMAYLERDGKNAPPVTSPWSRMSPYAYAPCPSEYHPRQPDTWAPPRGDARAPMPMVPRKQHLYDGSAKPTAPWRPAPPPAVRTIPSALGPIPTRMPPEGRTPAPHGRVAALAAQRQGHALPHDPRQDVRGFGGYGFGDDGFGDGFIDNSVPLVSSWDPTEGAPVAYRRARAPVGSRPIYDRAPYQSIVEPMDMTAPIYPGIGQEPAPEPTPTPTPAPAPAQASTGLGTYFVAGIVAGGAVALFMSTMGKGKKSSR